MRNNTTHRIAHELADKINDIQAGHVLMMRGTSAGESVLLNLKKQASELVQAIGKAKSYEEVFLQFDELVAALDTAELLGVVNEKDSEDYRKLMDKFAIEMEKEQ